jgi:5-methylcytosine-specific restriction endonuclease McrA
MRRPPLRPCIERLPSGRGCPNYAEPDTSRCAEHAHLTPRSKSRGTTAAWRKARQAALERDGYRCTVCGKTQQQAKAESRTGRGLEVHHLTGSHNAPGYSLARPEHPLDELVTLCPEHHRQTLRKTTRPTWRQEKERLAAEARQTAGSHEPPPGPLRAGQPSTNHPPLTRPRFSGFFREVPPFWPDA